MLECELRSYEKSKSNPKQTGHTQGRYRVRIKIKSLFSLFILLAFTITTADDSSRHWIKKIYGTWEDEDGNRMGVDKVVKYPIGLFSLESKDNKYVYSYEIEELKMIDGVSVPQFRMSIGIQQKDNSIHTIGDQFWTLLNDTTLVTRTNLSGPKFNKWHRINYRN